ncbi:hypothetical protein Dsin_030708 [Dipteronia sinensis]|uniref:RNase H type-1 domain-containing protein n=1 Tax=Dipteronia sinensis TaxID=43782 RepID=A0AAE0DRL9_9ROSI|nr:hypothetical protein Dsin_030708 [Dipteronia sinensis]
MRQAEDLVKFRVAWWFKTLGGGSSDSITAMVLNVKDCCVDVRGLKIRKAKDWNHPPAGSLRFNVDGLARGSTGIQDALTAEIMAIARSIDLCTLKQDLRGKDIVFESDSQVAVPWINGGGINSFDQVQLIFDIRSNLNILGHARVVFNSRANNAIVDSLAKKGSACGQEVLFWNLL